MPTFQYIALDPQGRQKRGSISAESVSAARRQLRNRRLHATRMRAISEAAHRGGGGLGRLIGSGRRRRVLADFTRQLATLVEADVQLTEALEVMIRQGEDEGFTQILQNVHDQVLSGEALADTLKDYPAWFDPIYVAMVRVGEVTGHLGRSLRLLSEHLTKGQRLQAKIISALIYPMILVSVAVGAMLLLMLVLVPKITRLIEESGRQVPALTVFVTQISRGLVDWWWLCLLAGLGIWYASQKVLATDRGRLAWDRLLLRVPLFGELVRQGIVVRFTSTLAALIRSGLPVAEGLQVVSEVIGNRVMVDAVRAARERIVAGADIATPLRESGMVSPSVAHMITVGERSGELETMLINVAESIEESTDITITRLMALIEPVIIVFVAVGIGMIVLAVVLPIFQAAQVT